MTTGERNNALQRFKAAAANRQWSALIAQFCRSWIATGRKRHPREESPSGKRMVSPRRACSRRWMRSSTTALMNWNARVQKRK